MKRMTSEDTRKAVTCRDAFRKKHHSPNSMSLNYSSTGESQTEASCDAVSRPTAIPEQYCNQGPLEPLKQREEQWARVAQRQQVVARELREALQSDRVLIVEDDLLAKHRMRLGELGFVEGKNFIAVTNLEDAHAAMAGGSIALLVTDMDFPRTQVDFDQLQVLSFGEFGSREQLIARNAGMELAGEATKQGIPVVASTSREDCEIPNISKGNYSVKDVETMLRALRTGQLSFSQQ